MQGRQPVPVTQQQRDDRAANLRGGLDIGKKVEENPLLKYIWMNAQPDPKAEAISLGTGMGLGVLGAAAGTATGIAGTALKGAQTAISGWFAYEGAKGATPELAAGYDDFKAGNYDQMLQHLGTGGTQALFAFLAGHEALHQGAGVVDDTLASHNAEATRLVKQDAGTPTPFLPPAEGKLTPQALDTMQRVEQDPAKRAALATEAKKRVLPVPDRGAQSVDDFMSAEEAKAAQSPDQFMREDAAKPATAPTDEDQYKALFDEADKRAATARKRAAQTPPEVPEEGVPDTVSRVADAREQLAQRLVGKPWADVSNSEAATIDDLVRQGYGSAQPAEKAPAESASETPARADAGVSAPAEPVSEKVSDAPTKEPTKVAYGKPTLVRVPGEDTSYPARYAIRESDDVQTSHDPVTFQPNPDYPHQNDRDYSNPENAARTVEYSMPGKFNPDYTLTDSPTAEHGSTITDQDANALGGNNRANVLKRVYDHPELGPMYKAALGDKAAQFGVDPAELNKFDKPVLTRELTGKDSAGADVDPQKAITDFNKGAPAALMPEERAVSDGKRMSPETLQSISGMIEDHGEGGSLADALRGDNGAEVVQHLVDDGVVTDQEKNGMVDQAGNLTPSAKERVAKALTGRLFDTPQDFASASPELRAKLERVAPQVFRVEGRPEWALGDHVKDAVSVLNEAKARGVNVDDLANQPDLNGKAREISPDALAIAKKLQEGPNKAAQAFRQYAGDEKLSRPGAQDSFFEPPTRQESFDSAFGETASKNGTHAEEMPGSVADRAATRPRESGGGSEPAPRPTSLPRERPGKVNPFQQKLIDVARSVKSQGRSIQKVFAPQTIDFSGEQAGLILRGRLSEAARNYDQAKASLMGAKKMFDRMPDQANHDFIDNVEHGRPQATPELDEIGKVMRGILDPRREAVQALGKGKLQQFFQNYFPHVWKQFDNAKQTIGQIMSRRPLEGSKGFLKQRTHMTFADGIAAGLEPVSKNPVTMVLLKAAEMDKYLLAHKALADFKDQGIAKYVSVDDKAPAGWTKIADPIGAVYGPSKIPISEYQNEGLYRGLSDFAESIGVNHDRLMKLQNPNALGLSHTGESQIDTKFGSDPQTLAHEIGHQLEDKYGLSDLLMKHPDARTRVQLNQQLRNLADLRAEGETPGPSRQSYLRSKDEKMAAVVQAYVAAPERMAKVAPLVKSEFEAFLKRTPGLRSLMDVKPNLKHLELQDHVDAGGLVTKGNYYAPDSAATLLNNHLAPGLGGHAAYRAGVAVNNGLNLFQLGLSGFHAAKVSVESMMQQIGLGLEQIERGRPLRGAATVATAPAAPFRTMIKGDKMLKEWYQPGAPGGLIGAYVDQLVKAGGRARMDDSYQTHVSDRMMEMFRDRGPNGEIKPGSVLGGIARVPASAVEFLPKLIMTHVVPRLKMGAFADAAEYDLQRLGPSDPDAVRKSLTQTWDSIEDRMGQMTRDNLFWHRTASDIAGLMTRSVGWNLGTIRGVGGGILDAIKAPIDLARGTKTFDQINLRRINNNVAMVGATMAWGALRTYMNTGQGPQSIKDYFFARKADGTRESPLSYVTDAYEFATSPLHTLGNKASPLVSMLSAILSNKDYQGNKLWDDDESLPAKGADAAKYVAKETLPISVRQFQQGSDQGKPLTDQIPQMVGIRNAPRDIDQTDAERTASQISAAAMSAEGRSKEQAARHEAEHKIAQLARAGQPTGPAIAEATRAGVLTQKQISQTLQNSRLSPLASQVHHMDVRQALRVWDAASPDERKTLRPILAAKRKTLQEMPAAERMALAPKLDAALKP